MHKIVTGCYVLQPDNLPLSDKGVHRILQSFAPYSDLTPGFWYGRTIIRFMYTLLKSYVNITVTLTV